MKLIRAVPIPQVCKKAHLTLNFLFMPTFTKKKQKQKEYQPQVAKLTRVGSDGSFYFLTITQKDPYTLLELLLSPSGRVTEVHRTPIPGLTGTPNWQLVVQQTPGAIINIIFLFATGANTKFLIYKYIYIYIAR